MAVFRRGNIVLVPFPFSAEQKYKVRPAVVLASVPYAGGTDYLQCAITTQPADDPHRMPLLPGDVEGRLTEAVFIRPTYRFTADEYFIRRRVAKLKAAKLAVVVQTLHTILDQTET